MSWISWAVEFLKGITLEDLVYFFLLVIYPNFLKKPIQKQLSRNFVFNFRRTLFIVSCILGFFFLTKTYFGDIFSAVSILTITALVSDKELSSVKVGIFLSLVVGYLLYTQEEKKQLLKIGFIFFDFMYAVYTAKKLHDIKYEDINTRISTNTHDIRIPIPKGLSISKLNSIGLQHIISITNPIAWDKDRTISGINKKKYSIFLSFSTEANQKKALEYLKNSREPFNKAVEVNNKNKEALLTKYEYDIDENAAVLDVLTCLQDTNTPHKIIVCISISFFPIN